MTARARYAAGEKQCEVCGKDLPAFECWRYRTHFRCEDPKCYHEYRRRILRKTVGQNEKRCDGPGCTKFVPAGSYNQRTQHFFCSPECGRQFWLKTVGKPVHCAYCGKLIYRRQRRDGQNYFCSAEHNHKFRSEKIMLARVGGFKAILDEYVGSFAKTRYRDQYGARNALSYFFHFLTARGISDLDEVTPKTITEFLAWEIERGTQGGGNLSYVSTFMDWLIAEGRRKHASPVVPKIHHVRRPQREPRPYSEEELKQIWKWLDERGNTRVRLAVAVGEETGLRIGEVCNIRGEDVNLLKQTIFVRLPNKTMTERTVPYHDKTRKYLELWLKERNPRAGVSHLLHNRYGRPCTQNQLQLEFCRVLCKYERKRRVNDEGLDRFSFHRLRHLMATRLVRNGADAATVMAMGGWVTATAMCGYAKVEPAVARRGYNEAMERARQERETPAARKRSRSLTQYVQDVTDGC